MKRNLHNEPRPKGLDEIMEAIDETGIDPSDCNAELERSDDDGDFTGWTAEIRNNEDGESPFSTLGYADKEDLLKDLKAAGFTDISEI